MLNLLTEQLHNNDIDELIQKDINELKEDFSYAYLKAELLKRKLTNENYIETTEKKLGNPKKKKEPTQKQKESLEVEKNKLQKLKRLQPYRNELLNSISEIKPSLIWKNFSSVYENKNFQEIEEEDRR